MEETKVAEAIIALASAVSDKDLTGEGDGTKATALTVLSDALGDPETDADTALYDAAQFATRRSTDTEEAAKSVLALSSGGGSQMVPLTNGSDSIGTVEFHDYETGEQVTEAPVGTCVMVTCKDYGSDQARLGLWNYEYGGFYETKGYLSDAEYIVPVVRGGVIATISKL